jgi:hypothetical protein
MDAKVFQWREGPSIRVLLLLEFFQYAINGNEKEHVLIYGTSKSMDETVFQWREGLSIRVVLLAEFFKRD